MSVHNFSSLIQKYRSEEVKAIIERDGFYDIENGGKWVDGTKEEVVLKVSAIVPLSNEDLKFDVGGTFNSESRKLYCYMHLEKGTKIVNTQYNGITKEYKILQERDYSDFDNNLHIYYLERGDRY